MMFPPGATVKIDDVYYKHQTNYAIGMDRWLKWVRKDYAWAWVPTSMQEEQRIRKATEA